MSTLVKDETTAVWSTRFNRGIYTLIIFLSREACLRVGKLGAQRFPRGYYTYTGSALGLGASGLSRRVSRHLQKEKRKVWHIDFFLAHKSATVITVIAAQVDKKMECEINSYIKEGAEAEIPVLGFGSSDCEGDCGSHLLYFGKEDIESKIVMLYTEKLGFKPVVINLQKQRYARARSLKKDGGHREICERFEHNERIN